MSPDQAPHLETTEDRRATRDDVPVSEFMVERSTWVISAMSLRSDASVNLPQLYRFFFLIPDNHRTVGPVISPITSSFVMYRRVLPHQRRTGELAAASEVQVRKFVEF